MLRGVPGGRAHLYPHLSKMKNKTIVPGVCYELVASLCTKLRIYSVICREKGVISEKIRYKCINDIKIKISGQT